MSQVEQVHASAHWSAPPQGSAVGVVARATSLASAIPLSEKIIEIAFTYRKRILAGLLLVYLLGFNAQWRPTPDSALYLTIGRNLFEGNGFTYHGEVNRLSYPGTPLLVAASFRLFRSESLTPLLIEMFLGGVIALALVYRLFLLHDGQKMAVWMTIGVGLCALFHRYCYELLSDMPFFIGAIGFFAGWEGVFGSRITNSAPATQRRVHWYDWALLVAGLLIAIVMRPQMWALLFATVVMLGVEFKRRAGRKPLILLAAIIVIGAIVWTINRRHHGAGFFGRYEDAIIWNITQNSSQFAHRVFLEYIPRLFDGVLSQTLFGCRFGIGLDALVGAAIIAAAVMFLKAEPIWRLWVGLLFLTTIVATEPIDRYFLAALPMLVYAWWKAVVWLHERLPKAWAGYAFLLILGIGGGTNIARTLIFTTEQRRVPFLNSYMQGHFASIYAVAELVSQQVPPDGYVLAPPRSPRILTYLSRRNVLEPTTEHLSNERSRPAFVLQPMNEPARDRLVAMGGHLGKEVGPSVPGKDGAWILNQVDWGS